MRDAVATFRLINNVSAETIPPCSLVKVYRRVPESGWFEVDQPDENDQATTLVSPPFGIAAGDTAAAPSDFPIKLAVDSACSAGDSLGAKSGQWTAHVGGSGWFALCDSFSDSALDGAYVWAARGVPAGYADPHNLTYTGEHSEAARTDTYSAFDGTADAVTVLWHRGDPPSDTKGVDVTQALGVAYYHAGDKKFYQYVADFHYDAGGRLLYIGPETRVEVDAAESC